MSADQSLPAPAGVEDHSDDASIRERLNSLLSEHSQSEIARKTGSLVASVNRYVHGARIPAAFCAALVRGLNVNPSWLLVGEGAPSLADVPADTAKLGGNLLALVEAMSAVARMRLGSLTGKHHLKVLRELNDALVAHERLREKLNEQSRPLFAEMLRDLQAALDKRDLARAGELRKAVEQLSRLCDDEDLERDFYRVQAYHEFQLKNSSRFLQLQRKLFLRSLPNDNLFDERACDEARRLVVALVQMNRLHEALQVCRATRNLAGKAGRRWAAFARLENTHGVILVELGHLYKGMALVQRSLPRLTGMYRKVSEAALAKQMLWAGLVRLEDAMAMSERNDAKAEHFLQTACWLSEPRLLEATLAYAEARDVEPVWRDGFFPRYARSLLKQLTHPGSEEAAAFEAAMQASPKTAPRDEGDWVRLGASVAHLYLAAGLREHALAQTLEVDRRLKSMDPEVNPEPLAAATHYRCVLALLSSPTDARQKGMIQQARHFFTRYIRGGYAILESALKS